MVDQSSSPLPWFLENGGKAERDQRSHDHRGRPVRAPAAPRFERATRFKIDWDIPGAQVLLAPAYYLLNRLHHREFVILLLITEVFLYDKRGRQPIVPT
jgi:hypothetical protein